MKKIFLFSLVAGIILTTQSQSKRNNCYWQQHVDYKMEVNMDIKNYQYKGTQEVTYTNNSSDTLKRVFYHLYPNAFQPGSEMDIRLKTISDPDKRMLKIVEIGKKEVKESRISSLKSNEIGYLKISNFKQDGIPATTKIVGTILEVELANPILPQSQTNFTLDFNGQIPLQIRRSGRNNEEGIELSMAQWYPKIAEYDFEGWHTDPYIGREFHGVWGNFDVKITIDKEYILGGTGYLINKNEIGYGYQDKDIEVKHDRKTKNLTWHFNAPMVHDFTWAADKDYIHDVLRTENTNIELHFLYKKDPSIIENWKQLQPKTAELMNFFNTVIGLYPYKQYSVIQGGDGGMEYAMCTLITGKRKLNSLIGVTAHELAHSWFQHILATNESKHPWMDEGFTSFISDLAMRKIVGGKENENPFESAYSGYFKMVATGKEQPQTTHGDRYNTNFNYATSTYSKGTIFLTQLGYVIGNEKLMETLKRYYYDFKFTHPTPNDFKRTAEKVSGAELDWYLTDWTQTTNTIDYGIKEVKENGSRTTITLERIGKMPMPVDLLVVYNDGTQETFYIPLRMMKAIKKNQYPSIKRTILKDWAWAMPTYEFTIDKAKKDIKFIVIDPSELMADVNNQDNFYKEK